MTASQEIWTAFGLLLTIGIASMGWMYTRVTAVHGRIDKVVNHMAAEDNKLDIKIEGVKDVSVRREEMLLHMTRLEKTQDAILAELKSQNETWRHKVGNIEQVAVRHDERLKHLEKT